MLLINELFIYKFERCLLKSDWIRDLKVCHNINLISAQETQLEDVEDILVDRFWDSSVFDSVSVEFQGRSGGLSVFGIQLSSRD